MATQIAPHLRLNLLVVLAVAGISALLGWFSQADGGGTFLIAGLLGMIALPVGGLVLLAIFAMLARDGWRIGSGLAGGTKWLVRGAAPAGLVLAVVALLYVPPLLSQLHRQHLLAGNLATFEDAMRNGEARVTLASGAQIVASPESGGRYYFSLGGLADNHQGFVLDRSGRAALAQGWADGEAGRFTAPDDVRSLFGGDMLECTRVRGDWFYCTFT